MPGSIGRGPARPTTPPPTTQTQTTQRTQPQPQATTAQPKGNPHQSNSNTAIPDRNDIHAATQKYPSLYGTMVQKVNGGLQSPPMGVSPFGISQNSKQSVLNNVQGVHNGTMTQGTAHGNEAVSFFKDGKQSLQAGNYKAAGMEFLGSGLNASGAVVFGGLGGFANPSLGSSRPTSGNSGTFD